MSNNIFGDLSGLGNILGGIAKSVVPKDTPEGKLFSAQSELSDLKNQENEIFLEIGRQAYEQDPLAWPQSTRLKLIHENIAIAQEVLNQAKHEQEQANALKAAEDAKGRCPNCDYKNTIGVKFCQECGTQLAIVGPRFCTSCGTELATGTKFCVECGAKQGE